MVIIQKVIYIFVETFNNRTMKTIKFYNHCNEALYTEAKRIIATFDWHPSYKSQTLSGVVDELECGLMVRTETGGHTVPFELSDVKDFVRIVSERD